jgi:hypothetical protein
MNDEPLDHVLRPQLPWRDDLTTECGLSGDGDRRVITRAAFLRRLKDQGKQRSAMTTCMTCWQTAGRYKDWATSPSDVMARNVNGWDETKKVRINSELRAIVALIEAHPEEFYGYLDGLESTSSLADARLARRRDDARGVKRPRPL